MVGDPTGFADELAKVSQAGFAGHLLLLSSITWRNSRISATEVLPRLARMGLRAMPRG